MAREKEKTGRIIDPDNELACWGDDSEGQAEPPVGTAWIDVAAGDEHARALDAFGVVACWGLDDDGRLDAPQGEPSSATRRCRIDRPR